jgi:hypothetical protein
MELLRDGVIIWRNLLFGWISQSLVGLVLLFSGAIKAIDSGRFGNHLRRYRFLPDRLVAPACVAIIAFECAFGAALILYLSPWLYPAGILLFAGFVALNIWGARARRIDDCGCYGGQVDLTPWQSAALDTLYAALLGFAWWQSTPPSAASMVSRVAVALGAGIAAGVLATRSRTAPLIDLGRLRRGARWKNSWLLTPPGRDFGRGSHLVVFMSDTCGFCKQWVPLLNILEVQPDLPSVTGILDLGENEVRRFSEEHLIRFPLSRMRSSLLSQMVDGFPTAVMIENGVIQQRFMGSFPAELGARIEQFYRAVAPPPARTAGRPRFTG